MYCRNCGNEINNNADVCLNCGVKAGNGDLFCPNCGKETNPNADFCVNCGMQLKNLAVNGKSKVAAGILGILLGGLGIHRMYLGYVGIGILQLFLSIFTCGISSLWGFIEGILILCGSGITTDSDGNPLI